MCGHMCMQFRARFDITSGIETNLKSASHILLLKRNLLSTMSFVITVADY